MIIILNTNIKQRNDIGLTKIKTLNFDGSEYSVQKYTINVN